MNIYCITIPYFSTTLKKSYNKSLEVTRYTVDKARDEILGVTVIKRLKTGWVEKPTAITALNTKMEVQNSISLKRNNPYVAMECYSSLELAIAAKYLYISKMKSEYEERIQKMKNSFYNNLPDVDKEIERIKKEHPEFFL